MNKTITANGLSELNLKAYKEILDNGETSLSRNGEVKELHNVHLTLEDPRLRHLSLEGRKNNIFATIAETFWVISGSDRLHPYLSFFLPRAPDFSDDNGATWRGAYGPRLYMYRQIQGVVEEFKNEGMKTRRAIIQIYMPEMDTVYSIDRQLGIQSTKDIPCNNTIHYMVSNDKKLHTNVLSRSGDAIWGALSINCFEWSFLQEMVMNAINDVTDYDLTLGSYNHTVSNLHLYDFTAKQAKEVISNDQNYEEKGGDLIFPKWENQDTHQDFFQEIVDILTESITEEKPLAFVAEGRMSQLFMQRDVPMDGNLLWTYTLVLAYYICEKRGERDLSMEIKDIPPEFFKSIGESPFRKFNLHFGTTSEGVKLEN